MSNDFLANLDALSLESSQIQRPGFGTAGVKVDVTTNHFEIISAPKLFYEYRIDYSRLAPKLINGKHIPGREVKWCEEKGLVYKVLRGMHPLNRIVHEHAVSDDYTLLWATKDARHMEIRFNDVAYVTIQGEREILPYVKLYFVRQIHFNNTPQELDGTAHAPENPKSLLQILNSFIRMPAKLNEELVQTGPSRFFPKDSCEPIDNILEVKRGFHVEARLAQKGCFVNINTSTTCFYRAVNLATLIRKAGINLRILKNLQVRVDVGKRMVGDVSDSQSNDIRRIRSVKPSDTFVAGKRLDSGSIDVSLPFINIGVDDNAGAQWVPSELLTILPHQHAHQDIAQLAVSKIITIAAQSANVNRERIAQISLPTLGLTRDSFLTKAGFEFSLDLLDIEARVLPNPSINYGPNNVPRIDEATWNLAGVRKLRKNGNLKQLHILCIQDTKQHGTEDTMKKFVGSMLSQLKFHGFPNPTYTYGVCERQRISQDLDGIFASYAQKGVRTLLIVLPEDDKVIYQKVKRVGSLEHGIATVCCLLSLVAKDSKQVASNVILKLNIKSGGINQALAPKELLSKIAATKGLIIMGGDVMHSSGSKGFPSVASIVSSVDNDFSVYLASMRLQRSLQERIGEMEAMVEERLQTWKAKNPVRTPTTIFFYRDGVGDSQFDEIESTEIPAIQKAWSKIFNNMPLKLNFVIVSKRHQQRLYPTKNCPREKMSKFGNNVKPGTMRPAHYYVLKNDSNHTADEMQGLTLALSYLHPICTRGVSYAAPGYDADRACESAKQLIDYELDPQMVQRKGEGKFAFRDRCLQYALQMNPWWNRAGRPGPWHSNLDGIPNYL